MRTTHTASGTPWQHHHQVHTKVSGGGDVTWGGGAAGSTEGEGGGGRGSVSFEMEVNKQLCSRPWTSVRLL